MKIKSIFFLPILFITSILRAQTLESTITAADICRTEYVQEAQLPLYLGNGRFGGCFDQRGECSLMHVSNYGRGRYEMDYLLPVVKLYWSEASGIISRYFQHQSMYDGIVTTSFSDNLGQLKIKEWFDASERNLFVLQIEKAGKDRHLVIEFPTDVKTHYGSKFHGEVSYQKVNNGWTVTTSLTGCKKEVEIITSAGGDIIDGKLVLQVCSGDYLAISCGSSDFVSSKASFERTRKWWNVKWKNAPMVFVPDHNVQNLFIRSLAQLYSTCNEDGIGLMPPCGLSGNAWPFPFPHDLSFILSTLLSAGSSDIAKSWVEYLAKDTDGLREYTKHVFGVDGIYAPWCYPYGGLKGLNLKGVPNRAFYEIHNSGHLCRMAYETSLFINDSSWTEKYAKPLVKGCVDFYLAMLIKESDGLWHIFHIPSFGQDENGGSNQKDYLDALYSAKYCLETAVKMGVDSDGKCAAILSDGLAFQTLKSSRGYYVSCFGRGESDFGNQKHPVQLNEITLLPMDGGISAEAQKAYKDRYDITERASEPFSRGWTCGSFILASARMGDPQGWSRDWSSLVPADAVDKDYIQFYESSRLQNKAYFITNSGLFVGSLLTCAVNDWEGEIRIGSCNPWNKLLFNNIWSKLGVVVSGTAGQKATITAWKDCSVRIEGSLYSLKKGQQIEVDLHSKCKSKVSQLHLPEYKTVDLGLSVNWSAMNVGATAENQYGDEFAFEDASACNSDGYSIPSISNWQELISKCKWTRANVNGIEGYKVVSMVPGYTDRQIFLPSAGCRTGLQYHSRGIDGYYWSSSELEGKNQYAWSILATSGHVYKSDSYKFIKQSVRLVAPKPENGTKPHEKNSTEGIYLSVNNFTGLYSIGDTCVFFAGKSPSQKEDLTMTVYVEGIKRLSKSVSLDSEPKEIFRCVSDSTASVIIRIGVTGKKNPGNSIGVIYSPDSYRPGFDEPADFISYWDKEKRKLRKNRPNVTVKSVESCDSAYKVFDVEISMPEGQPVRGYMAMPVNAVAKSLPVLLYTHSAGVARYENRATIERAVKFARRGNGVIALDINAHGFMNDRPQSYYDELDKGVLKNYRADNLTSRENYYFRLMILRLVRAMDFLCSLPQWDGIRAVVYGESQGGFQAAALAGLDSRVTFAMMNVPAHMDIGSPLQGRKAAWPGIYDKGMKTTPELVNKILPYFDAANFLRHTKAKLVFEAGLVDETCPPGCVFAGYNVCSSPDKHIFIYPYRPHVPGNMQKDKIGDWVISIDTPKHKLLDDYLR